MPSGPLAHICLLVKDLDRRSRTGPRSSRSSIPRSSRSASSATTSFEGGEDRMRWATFVNPGGAEIQLMEPDPDSPLGRRLAKHGEGVHHICFTTDNPEETLEAARRRRSEHDRRGVNSDPTMPWQRWTWVLPDSAHGTLVEVARPYLAVDGKWESAVGGRARMSIERVVGGRRRGDGQRHRPGRRHVGLSGHARRRRAGGAGSRAGADREEPGAVREVRTPEFGRRRRRACADLDDDRSRRRRRGRGPRDRDRGRGHRRQVRRAGAARRRLPRGRRLRLQHVAVLDLAARRGHRAARIAWSARTGSTRRR